MVVLPKSVLFNDCYETACNYAYDDASSPREESLSLIWSLVSLLVKIRFGITSYINDKIGDHESLIRIVRKPDQFIVSYLWQLVFNHDRSVKMIRPTGEIGVSTEGRTKIGYQTTGGA